MMNGLLSIITVRTDSQRLFGKCLLPIKSRVPGSTKKETQPLIVWLIRRARQLPGALVGATTTDSTDNELAKVMREQGIEVIRGSKDDVLSRMDAVIQTGSYPGTKIVTRILADCPFISTRLVAYAANRLEQTGKDAFVYSLPPDILPLYGCREFGYSLRGWNRIVRDSEHREHPDMYFHLNRQAFDILYHLPPDSLYFRPYRLELDTASDASLVEAIADGVGMLASVSDVVKFLDANPSIARINADQVEKTGPFSLSTYNNSQRRKWLMGMVGRPIMAWTGEMIQAPDPKATPIFCNCGELIGHGYRGRLRMRDGSIMDRGFPKCRSCGLMVREWKEAIQPAGY